MNEMRYATDIIATAKRYDAHDNAQMRDAKISQLRSDSNLPTESVNIMLRNAGLIRDPN